MFRKKLAVLSGGASSKSSLLSPNARRPARQWNSGTTFGEFKTNRQTITDGKKNNSEEKFAYTQKWDDGTNISQIIKYFSRFYIASHEAKSHTER